MHRLLAFLLPLALAACTLALPGGRGADAPSTAAISPGAVAVTPLAPPPTAQGAKPATPEPAAAPPETPKGAKPAASAYKPATAAPEPQKGATPAAPAKPAPPAPLPAPPPPPEPAAEATPPEQLACQAKGGIWSETGLSSLKTCIQRTRDGGKSCRRQGDCEGLCLARSKTCAPVTPMFGCNPILQADGSEATLCID